jgi:hypothetical protein
MCNGDWVCLLVVMLSPKLLNNFQRNLVLENCSKILKTNLVLMHTC